MGRAVGQQNGFSNVGVIKGDSSGTVDGIELLMGQQWDSSRRAMAQQWDSSRTAVGQQWDSSGTAMGQQWDSSGKIGRE